MEQHCQANHHLLLNIPGLLTISLQVSFAQPVHCSALLTMFAFRVLEPALVHTKVVLQITPIQETNTYYRQLIGGFCIRLRFLLGAVTSKPQ